jgi:hypothetical protein
LSSPLAFGRSKSLPTVKPPQKILMKNNKKLKSVVVSALLLTSSCYCSAQLVDIGPCRTIKDSLERFVCYEKLGELVGEKAGEKSSAAAQSITASTAAAPPVVVAPPAAAVVAPAASTKTATTMPDTTMPDTTMPTTTMPATTVPTSTAPTNQAPQVETFGRTETPAARVVEGTDGKTELVDTVAALKQLTPTQWLITLKSGQQWRQVTGKTYRLKVGDEVKIYPANSAFGESYRLSNARVSGQIAVERVD